MKRKYYINGIYVNNTCCDCGKNIGRSSKRCHSCSQKGNRNHRFNKHSYNYKGEKYYCIDCKKEVSTKNTKRCRSCAQKFLIKSNPNKYFFLKNNKNKKNSNYKYGKYSDNKQKCTDCGKEISKISIRCKSCANSLNNNPNWLDGISFEPYPLRWNKTFKEQIRFRDGYKCQLCGKPEVENNRKLSVHHIDYNKININEKNLITLCINCHTKTNFNRKKWRNKFMEEMMERGLIDKNLNNLPNYTKKDK